MGFSVSDSATYERTKGLLEEAQRLDPDNVRIQLERLRLIDQAVRSELLPPEARAGNKAAIQRVLTDYPNHAIANMWMAWEYFTVEKNYAAVGPYIERATAAAPNDVNVLRGLVRMMWTYGRLDEAAQVSDYLIEHDPLCVICLVNAYSVDLLQGDTEAAVVKLRELISLTPNRDDLRGNLAVALIKLGRLEEAKSAIDQWSAEYPEYDAIRLLLRKAMQPNKSLAPEIEVYAQRWPKSARSIATLYAHEGDHDKAFEWLNVHAEQFQPGKDEVWSGPYAPMLDMLKGDPRWEEYLRRVGFAPEQLAGYELGVTLPGMR